MEQDNQNCNDTANEGSSHHPNLDEDVLRDLEEQLYGHREQRLQKALKTVNFIFLLGALFLPYGAVANLYICWGIGLIASRLIFQVRTGEMRYIYGAALLKATTFPGDPAFDPKVKADTKL